MVSSARVRAAACGQGLRIGIIAALPGELQPLVRRWQRMPASRGSGISIWQRREGEDEVIAVCAGMGAPAARRAFVAAEYLGSLDLVLSVGWAGALVADCEPGECFVASEVIDAQTGEHFVQTEGERRLRVVTTVRVADAEEKQRLAATYGAMLVDMEAAAVARLAQMRGIPMGCFKAVSDGVEAELPDLNPFIDISGKLRMGPFLAHVALRPMYWGALGHLGRSSAAAAKALARKVEAFLVEKDLERVNREG